MSIEFRSRCYPVPIARTALSLAFLCAGTLLSCDSVAPTDPNPGAATESLTLARTLRSIEVSPSNFTLLVDLNQIGSRAFKVLARYNDRSTADVTAASSFTLNNPAVGALTGGRFDSVAHATSMVDFATVTVNYREGAVALTATTNMTIAWLRTSGANPDLLLTLPYEGATKSTTVGFGTTAQALDAFYAVDTTGSMGGEINQIQRDLDATVLPAVQAAVANSWVGVGAVEDFPAGTYGSPNCGPDGDDEPFILLSPMTGDFTAAKTAFDKLLRAGSPRGCGNDLPEGHLEALYQIATGNGNVVPSVVNIPPHHTKGLGGVEFRNGALPVITVITDAVFHTLGEPTRMCAGEATDYAGPTALAAHSRTATTTALTNVCARVIGLSAVLTVPTPACDATADLRQTATATGALVPPQAWDATGTRPVGCAAGQCCTGLAGIGQAPDADGMCPLVMLIQTAGVGTGQGAADAITQLVHFSPSDVSLVKGGTSTGEDGTALPTGKSTADFMVALSSVDGLPPAVPAGLKPPVVSGDHFTGVIPGSSVRFTIDAKNDFIAAGAKPQVFKATLKTLASGCALLDARDVLIIVPAS